MFISAKIITMYKVYNTTIVTGSGVISQKI